MCVWGGGAWLFHPLFFPRGGSFILCLLQLLPKCHPLGLFEELGALAIAQSPAELYNSVLQVRAPWVLPV